MNCNDYLNLFFVDPDPEPQREDVDGLPHTDLCPPAGIVFIRIRF